TTVPMGPLRADGLEAYTVTAQVERPDSGAVVSGLEVSITLADGPGPLLIGDPAMTNQQGQASIDLRSNTPGSFVVSVQLEDSASRTRVLEEQPQITFRSPAPDVTLNSTFMASRTDGIVANGSDATQLTVTVRAPDNQPVADVPVRLEVSGGSNLLTPNAGTTDPAGVYTADLTSTVAELKQAQAILWPDSPDEVTLTPLELRFVGDPNAIDQLNSTIVASPPGPLVADGIEAYTLEVTVVDQRGNPVNGLFVQFESTVDGDLLTQPSDPTDGEGVATGEVRAVEPGSRDLSAMVLDAEMNTLAVLPAVPLLFRAIPGQPDPAQTVVAAVPDQIIANGQEASLVTVTVRDGNGDPVNGQEVELNTAGVDVVLEPIETVTDLQGQWTARLRGEQEGTVTVSAVIDPDGEALAVVDTATVELLTDPERVDPGRSSVVLTPDRVFDADGVDTAVLVVTLLNAAGEPIVGRTVSGGASPDVGVGFGAAAPTDGAGQTTVTLTSTEVGTVTVVVTDTVYAIALDDTPEVSFREPPRPDAINSELTPSRQRAEADGVDTVTLAVMALDQYGEPLDGLPVSWEVVEVSTGVGVPRPVPDDTTDAGSAEVTLTSATPGLLEVVVTLGTGPEAVVLGPIEVLFEPVSLPPQITLETATAVEGCAPLGYTLAQQDGEPVWVEVNWRDTSTANPPVSARQARDIGRAHVGVSGLAAGAAPTAYSFVWDSLRDVGRRDLEIDVLARARTATSDWSPISVQTFQVNNGLRFTDVNRPPSNSGRIQDVAVGDFSGDGYDEVVVTSPDFRITYVLNNVAAFGGQSVYGSGPQLNMLSGSVATVVGDADGDGDLDLIEVASFIGNTQLRVLVNEGSNVWSQGPLLDLGPGQAVDLVAGNLDDDLGDEVVVTFTDRMAQVSDPLDIGAAVESNPTAGEPGHLELVDMDHDGLLDVVTTQGGQVMLARVEPEEDPMGMGGPMPVEIREVALMLGGGPVDRLHTGDFNGDGLRDLLTWDAATEEATLHLQDASGGTWSLGETIDIGPVGDMVAANFDHAGGTDLAIFDDTTERIETWLQMDGTLVYSGSTPVTENVPTVPR
ncbi:MAG: Ig-like domain-containing protein, partial [Myxococcota bacterium]